MTNEDLVQTIDMLKQDIKTGPDSLMKREFTNVLHQFAARWNLEKDPALDEAGE